MVVRQVADDPQSHLISGVGVRFVDLDPRDEARIDRYVNLTIEGAAAEGDEDATGRRE